MGKCKSFSKFTYGASQPIDFESEINTADRIFQHLKLTKVFFCFLLFRKNGTESVEKAQL